VTRPTPASGVATHVAHGDLQVTMLTGADARTTLATNDFRGEWCALQRACPWATVFQGPSFGDAWWQVYDARYDPLILMGRRAGGPLRGLLMLARDRQSGEVLHVGTHHAEYHAWLAHAGDSDAFMLGAMQLLRQHKVCRVLRFMYLAPGTPIGWTRLLSDWWAPGVIVHSHLRGLRELDSNHPENSSLRKKGTRSKLQRLSRSGPVEFRVLQSAEELQQWMPQIRRQCDQRHGGHLGIGPFGKDARKEQLFARFFETPGLLHASVLTRGDQLLASHLGLIDGRTVSLGLFTHDLDEHANSPGKLLLHFLAQRLAADGFELMDMTPGDQYKLRFATRSDVVHTLEVRFSTPDLMVRRLTSSRDTAPFIEGQPERRVLFMSYFYPPLLSSGTARSVEFSRRLPALGWQVRVLTVRESRDPWEKGRGGDVPAGVEVVRSTELPLAEVLDLLHAVWTRVMALLGRSVKGHLLRALFAFPDPQVAWQSTVSGVRHGGDCDVIYASCSPFSSALSARLVAALLRKPLVLDFRDPWTLNPYMRSRGLRLKLMRAVERWCLSGAARVLLNSRGTERLYRRAYPQFADRFRTVPNGFDRLTPVEPAGDGVFRILHIGSFYGARRPDLLLDALAELIEAGEIPREQVEFVQVGEAWPHFGPYRERVPIREVPPVPRDRALELMAEASLLYLKQGWEEGITDYVSVAAKTYEYLATGLPVLAECPPGDNFDIVRDYSERRYLVPSRSADEMREAVRAAWRDRALPPGTVSPAFIQAFSRDNLARTLANELSAVLVETP
jgi:CelD/BcsL family acetyltransferase involved in cellulose biosynthesis/glycosyltransferase involved in cell wall biosynthesis